MIEVRDYLIASAMQGPRSNFEIGGGEAPLVTQYWGAQNTFSY